MSRRGNGRGRGGLLGGAVTKLASGIGLVSEYRQARKEQEAAKELRSNSSTDAKDAPSTGLPHPPTEKSPPPYSEIEVAHEDEVDWRLDEAQDELVGPAEQTKLMTEHNPKKMIEKFTLAHPVPTDIEIIGLSLPVVLPQRRPKDRQRGFIRAYAPELQNNGIDQDTFIELVETFNTATMAAPWINAVNLAGLAFSWVPMGISIAISVAIAKGVDTAKALQSQRRQNYVLDQLNEDFFQPRGLYALVLTWNPESANSTIGIDINQTISGNLAPKDSTADKLEHSFRSSAGNTIGTAFEETAPLVFPALDLLNNSDAPEAKELKNKIKGFRDFAADYFDRRAQATYANENPDSQLAVKPTFTSKYSDPNHASNSGGLLGLATGGQVSLPDRRDRRGDRFERSPRRRDLRHGRGMSFESDMDQGQHTGQQMSPAGGHGLGHRGGRGRGQRGGLVSGGLKRVLQQHVLYLAIVNMPSDAELAEATARIDEHRSRMQI